MIEWWKVQPKQAAPPRQTGFAKGADSGRFIMDENFLKMNELRVGRKTLVGSQIELPKVQPIMCFVLWLINVACYGTYVNVGLLQGPDAAREFLSALVVGAGSDPLAWTQGLPVGLAEQLGHALSACFMASGPIELLVTLWALALVAPRAESIMGYGAFTSIYLLSGITGTTTHLILSHQLSNALADPALIETPVSSALPAFLLAAPVSAAPLGACGATAAVMGIVACTAVHAVRSSGLEVQAAKWSKQAKLAVPTPSFSTPWPHVAGVGLATLGLAAAHQALGLAGMPEAGLELGGLESLMASVPAFISEEGASCLSLPAVLAGGLAGGLLTLGMGPDFTLQREVDIPEGSMVVPEDAVEMCIVLDRNTGFQKFAWAGLYSAGLLGVLATSAATTAL